MRKVLLTTLLALITFAINAQFSSNADIDDHNLVTINKYPVNGYAEHLPPDYYSNPTKKYPIIVMLHGQGEYGNGSSDLWKVVRQGPGFNAERDGQFCIDGECFIVITPQLVTGSWVESVQQPFWDYILNQRGLRYDPNRIYLTGLSLGGNGVWNWITSDYPLADKIAAASVMAGWGNTSRAYKVNQRGIATWGFHGTADPVIAYNSGLGMNNAVANSSNPYNVEHKWTAFANEGHNIWWNVYRFDEAYVSPNMWRWMKAKRWRNGQSGGGSTPDPNNAPTVSAGADITVGVSSGGASLTANASDSDGSIVGYNWVKISGPSVSMWNTNSRTMNLSNFAASGGTYEFQVTVTDNDGATASDRVRVTKQVTSTGGSGSGGTNAAPTVSAGADITVSYSVGSASIQASASDSDGSIASYNWTKVSGPGVSMWSTGSSKLTLSNFAASGGTYVFRVTVTDNDGAQAHDDVTLVKQVVGGGSSTTGNSAPSVSAGSDFTVPLTTGSASIQGSASDSDGTIASWAWTKVSGPSVDMWSTGSPKLLLSNFNGSGGTYVFRLTVTDNDGAKASDDVIVTKETSASGSGITVSAGADMVVDLYAGNAVVDGWASDANGSIVKYEWTKVSGPGVSMWSTGSPDLILSNFAVSGGVYEFRLTVTDNAGNVAADVMRLTKLTTLSSSSSNNINYSINTETGEFEEIEQQVDVRNYRTDGSAIEFSSTQPMRLIIMGINGRMISDETVNGTLNPGVLSNGMYIYRLVTEEGTLVQKGRIIRY